MGRAMVRVVHVIAGNLWGGIESFVATVARAAKLAPSMHSEFALCFDGRLRRELSALGAAVIDLGPVRARSPWSVLRARGRLARHIEASRADVVVCHSAWAQAMFGNVAPRAGVPAVFYLHDLVRARFWLERWASLHRPDLAIANSAFVQESLRELFPQAPSTVVRYPIEAPAATLSAEERRAIRSEYGAGDDTAVIVHASRMQAWKGHARLFRALARLDRASPWLCLAIGGAQRAEEHAYVAGLETLARELGIADRVRFLGQRSDVPRLLAASDIHCQSNATPEPFGIVFVEALLAGLPVLTFGMGGAREIVTPEVGRLVENDAELARELQTLVSDASLRQRLGRAAPARGRELCDPARQLAALEAALEQVVGASGASGLDRSA